VWNRTPGRAAPLLALGAVEANSPRDLARDSEVVVTCLTDSPQLGEVLFGPDGLAERFRGRVAARRLLQGAL